MKWEQAKQAVIGCKHALPRETYDTNYIIMYFITYTYKLIMLWKLFIHKFINHELAACVQFRERVNCFTI